MEGSSLKRKCEGGEEEQEEEEYFTTLPDEIVLLIIVGVFTSTGQSGWKSGEDFASKEPFNASLLCVCKRRRRLLYAHVYIPVVRAPYRKTIENYSLLSLPFGILGSIS